MKKPCVWRKRGSCFDEREREEKELLQIKISKDIENTKECIHQLENSLKDTNGDLLRLFRFLFAG